MVTEPAIGESINNSTARMSFQANRPAKATPPTLVKRGLAAALIAASAALLMPACADNESSLFIRDCVPAEPQDASQASQQA